MTPLPPVSVAAENAKRRLRARRRGRRGEPGRDGRRRDVVVMPLTAVGGPPLPALSTATTKYWYAASVEIPASVKLVVVGLPARTSGAPTRHTS